jgi:hypothetical protein
MKAISLIGIVVALGLPALVSAQPVARPGEADVRRLEASRPTAANRNPDRIRRDAARTEPEASSARRRAWEPNRRRLFEPNRRRFYDPGRRRLHDPSRRRFLHNSRQRGGR